MLIEDMMAALLIAACHEQTVHYKYQKKCKPLLYEKCYLV